MDATGYGDLRARRETTIWQQMNHVLRVLLVIAVWLLIISFFMPPYKRLQQGRAEMEQLQAQLTDEKNQLTRQTRDITLLKSDPTFLETIARDKLDVMKEGATIFRLERNRGGFSAKPRP
ncbi:MAG: FtsB family cell division protein [Chthoniobacterales bacterium]